LTKSTNYDFLPPPYATTFSSTPRFQIPPTYGQFYYIRIDFFVWKRLWYEKRAK
jgi:hypothetical protein